MLAPIAVGSALARGQPACEPQAANRSARSEYSQYPPSPHARVVRRPAVGWACGYSRTGSATVRQVLVELGAEHANPGAFKEGYTH
jgi:hypothetical protein